MPVLHMLLSMRVLIMAIHQHQLKHAGKYKTPLYKLNVILSLGDMSVQESLL